MFGVGGVVACLDVNTCACTVLLSAHVRFDIHLMYALTHNADPEQASKLLLGKKLLEVSSLSLPLLLLTLLNTTSSFKLNKM